MSRLKSRIFLLQLQRDFGKDDAAMAEMLELSVSEYHLALENPAQMRNPLFRRLAGTIIRLSGTRGPQNFYEFQQALYADVWSLRQHTSDEVAAPGLRIVSSGDIGTLKESPNEQYSQK